MIRWLKDIELYGTGENARTNSVSKEAEVPITAAKDEKAPAKAIDPTPSFKKTTFADDISKRTPRTDPGSSIKKTPTFADERSGTGGSRKPEGAVPEIVRPPARHGRTASKSDIPPAIKPATPPAETKRQSSTAPRKDGTKADAWEKAEMAKIKER